LHRIKALLYENMLAETPDTLIARVISEKSLTIERISQLAVRRGGADVSAAKMKHVVEQFFEEMLYNLCDGFSVNTGYFTVQPVIRGVFNSPTEQFDSDKHSVSFDFQQGTLSRKELKDNVEVAVLGLAPPSILIAQVTDVWTESVNDQLTPSHNLVISGAKLKIVGERAENGVYFINQETEERTKVNPKNIVHNNPSEVTILIPLLPAGMYKIEVVTQFGSNSKTLLKEPRSAVFDKALTVM
jgi:nucleoid DNA-binding protein